MRLLMSRIVAILLLVIPGLLATKGFLLLKDSLFEWISFGSPPYGSLLLGLLLFSVGVAFIGGWIFFRDRKHNYVAPRFREKKPRNPRT